MLKFLQSEWIATLCYISISDWYQYSDLVSSITIVAHNKDQPEIFQNFNRMHAKAAFRALDLSIKCSRPFPSDLKTDLEVL